MLKANETEARCEECTGPIRRGDFRVETTSGDELFYCFECGTFAGEFGDKSTILDYHADQDDYVEEV